VIFFWEEAPASAFHRCAVSSPSHGDILGSLELTSKLFLLISFVLGFQNPTSSAQDFVRSKPTSGACVSCDLPRQRVNSIQLLISPSPGTIGVCLSTWPVLNCGAPDAHCFADAERAFARKKTALDCLVGCCDRCAVLRQVRSATGVFRSAASPSPRKSLMRFASAFRTFEEGDLIFPVPQADARRRNFGLKQAVVWQFKRAAILYIM
jgi:hypothetical protein